jgi:hypothetical protein
MLSDIGVGKKDLKKSLFGVWDNLFHVTKSRGNELLGSRLTSTKYFNELLTTIDGAEDQEILLSGCFHNYLIVMGNEPAFEKINKVLEWMHFGDSLSRAIYERQEFEFMAYTPFTIMQFYPHCATARRPALEFPRKEFEVLAQQKTNVGIMQTVLEGLPSHFKFINRNMLVKEFLSPLMRIISPINFRPVSCAFFFFSFLVS